MTGSRAPNFDAPPSRVESQRWTIWFALESYGALERFRALARVDDKPVWSVVCFFVDRSVRRAGVTEQLLRAAVEYAREQGAAIIEGYPVEPRPRLYTCMGSPSTFRRAGFRDVTPLGRVRRVVRWIDSTSRGPNER
jgi:GNAT superfamily N-acetyltransferase